MALCRRSVVPVVLQHYRQLVRTYCARKDQKEHTGGTTGEQQEHIKADANAYEVLGLPESCSEASIRATFRKLAKATHPDLQADTFTVHFIRILAAYEILSDPPKRAEYDKHLKSKRGHQQTRTNVSQAQETSSYGSEEFYRSGFYEQEPTGSSTEVVSWLKGYRAMVKDVIHRQEIGVGRGWEEELRGEVQSALKKAYFGPPVSELQGLPECFEAEERSQPGIQDVLHLVSGRQLFGVVRQVKDPLLERSHQEVSFLLPDSLQNQCNSRTIDLSDTRSAASTDHASVVARSFPSYTNDHNPKVANDTARQGNAYVDLELQLFGNVVARSIRVPVKLASGADTSGSENTDAHDCIYIYLSSDQVEDTSEFMQGTVKEESKFSRILLGTICGLSSIADGNPCFVHGSDGKRTHLILQHRTPLVKHIQWFRIGEESARCECRCRRATYLPSRYWIFEPRTDTHNVGGWYIETFNQSRSHKSKNQGQGRYVNHGHMSRHSMGTVEDETQRMSDLLHPAMYIIAAAYKTLDEEYVAAETRKKSIPNKIKKLVNLQQITSGFSHWWKQKWKNSVV